jgi:hypothetical protein
VEQLGAGSGAEGVETLPESALEVDPASCSLSDLELEQELLVFRLRLLRQLSPFFSSLSCRRASLAMSGAASRTMTTHGMSKANCLPLLGPSSARSGRMIPTKVNASNPASAD